MQLQIKNFKGRCDQMQNWLLYLQTLYEDKYGKAEPITYSINDAAVQNAFSFYDSETRHPFVLADSGGFFSKKPKKKDYENGVHSVQILAYYFQNTVSSLEKIYDMNFGETYRGLGRFFETEKNIRRNVLNEDALFGEYRLSAGKDTYIYLGDMYEPVDIEGNSAAIPDCNFTKEFVEGGIVDGNWLKFPFAYACFEPFCLFIDYKQCKFAEEDSRKFRLKELLHSILYQIIQGMPAYSYAVTYLDPLNGGASLEEMQKLSGVVNGNAYWMQEKVFASTFKLMEKGTDEAGTKTILNDLCIYIDAINEIRAGSVRMGEYITSQFADDGNLKEDSKVVPHKFLIFENVNGILSQEIFQKLKLIISNARDCGISILIADAHLENVPLSDLEKELKENTQLDVLDWDSKGCSVRFYGRSEKQPVGKSYIFNFRPSGLQNAHGEYIRQLTDYFTPSFNVETRYEELFDIDGGWSQDDCDNEINFPIGVNERGKVMMTSVGGSDGAHALLAGTTGCGKSSFIQTIITYIVMHYSPKEVQIWLSDYKSNEFQKYMVNTPPHISYIATAHAKEYSFAFLDRIYDEYQRRQSLFGEITSLAQYRQKNGKESLPRIIIIIDEFHVLSNHVQDEPNYKQKLTNILREVRSYGMSLFLSDQTCGVGLRGLSDSAKLNITRRMAMLTTTEEYGSVFDIPNVRQEIPEIAVHEILIKRSRLQTDENGRRNLVSYYEHDKTIYSEPEFIAEVMKKAIARYGTAGNTDFIKGDLKQKADWAYLLEENNKRPLRNGFPLFLGMPLDYKSFFRIHIQDRYSGNICCVGGDSDSVQADIVAGIIESFRHDGFHYRIIVFAEETDSVFENCEAWLEKTASEDKQVRVITREEEICSEIMKLSSECEQRLKEREHAASVLVLWLGLYDLYRDFERLPARPADAGKRIERKTSQSELEKEFISLFGGNPVIEESENETVQPDTDNDSLLYNASEDVRHLMEDGPRAAVHQAVFYSNVSMALKTKCAPLNGTNAVFSYRIAMRMSKEEALDYLGQSRLILTADGNIIDSETAVYTNGKDVMQFVPFESDMESTDSDY